MKKAFWVPFGQDFIGMLYQLIMQEKVELSRVAVVFPGKRPSLYLKKIISEHVSAPFLPPQFFSIEEFTDFFARKEHPDYRDIEDYDAIWLIYKTIQSLSNFDGHPLQKKSFAEFFWWGKYLLQFINQLDLENIADEKLSFLEMNAELGYDVPESTNEVLAGISLLRRDFHRTLHNGKFFTRGYKYICSLKYIQKHVPDDFERVFFAGLFALSSCEKHIVQRIWDTGRACIVLEGDPSEWPILDGLLSFLQTEARKSGDSGFSPEISIHSGVDTHSEALTTYELLKNASDKKIAVVIPASDALFPVLDFALDRLDRPYNISLGYPLWRTPLFDLVTHVLHAHSQKNREGEFPAAEYLSIMFHPFVKNLTIPDVRPHLFKIKNLFTDRNIHDGIAYKQFISPDEVETRLVLNGDDGAGIGTIHDIFFRSFEKAGTLKEYAQLLEDVLDFILHNTPIRSYVLSEAIFTRFYEDLEKLKESQFASEVLHQTHEENRRAICEFIREHLKGLQLAFETKPIEDLEILGVLESRNIAFDRVIVLDMNEGIMPGAKTINPLIPAGIYETIGIPSPEYNEEMFRYYLHRLIGSARKIDFIYLDSEEKPRSRYIEQIIWEQELKNNSLNSVNINKMQRRITASRPNTLPVIEKTPRILTILRNKTYSPASIDDYIVCPVLFYNKHILAFEELTNITDGIESIDRGKMVHSILHHTFEPYLNREVSADMFGDMVNTMRKVVTSTFRAEEISGEYYLFKKIVMLKIESFLRRTIKEMQSPFIPKELEVRLRSNVQTGNEHVTIKGIVDRVDYHPQRDCYEIIDYKTGGVLQYPRNNLDVNFESINDIHVHIRSFQLPTYIRLFMNQFPVPLANTNAKLVLLGNNTEELLLADDDPEDKEVRFTNYMRGLTTVMTDILDPSKPLSPFDILSCPQCSFRDLCHM